MGPFPAPVRWLAGLAAVLLLLGGWFLHRAPEEPADGVVRSYLSLVRQQKQREARALLTRSLAADSAASGRLECLQQLESTRGVEAPDADGVVMTKSVEERLRARVRLRDSAGTPRDGILEFTLRKERGSWRIDDIEAIAQTEPNGRIPPPPSATQPNQLPGVSPRDDGEATPELRIRQGTTSSPASDCGRIV